MNAEQALQRLRDGNARFQAELAGSKVLATQVDINKMGGSQKPFAVILGCADSRVPPELIFQQSFGDLFVVRVAGNIAAPSQIGSIEFACQNFGSPLIMVLGHTQCGAVAATVDCIRQPPENVSRNLAAIVDRVQPAVEPVVSAHAELPRDELLRSCGHANIRHAVRNLEGRSAVLRELIGAGKLAVTGAEYDIQSGVVTVFD